MEEYQKKLARIMKKLLIICIGLCTFFSCIDYSEERESLKGDFHHNPTTEKERAYFNQLKSQGFSEVNFFVPVLGRYPKNGNFYKLSLTTKQSIDSSNLDSLTHIRDSIANHLFTDVIEDSILININKIIVDIKGKNELSLLYENYYIDSMSRKHNFKVVRLGKDIYDRVPYWKKNR